MFQLSTSTENQNDQNVNGFIWASLRTMPGASNQDEQNNRDIEQGEDSVQLGGLLHTETENYWKKNNWLLIHGRLSWLIYQISEL